jgi:hypothetical protein
LHSSLFRVCYGEIKIIKEREKRKFWDGNETSEVVPKNEISDGMFENETQKLK